VRVVGLGGLDDLRDARKFVTEFGIGFTMLFDSTLRSWSELKIVAQPAAILLAPNGSEIKRWMGEFPEDEVLRLAAGHRG
jgi:hypothetical protein